GRESCVRWIVDRAVVRVVSESGETLEVLERRLAVCRIVNLQHQLRYRGWILLVCDVDQPRHAEWRKTLRAGSCAAGRFVGEEDVGLALDANRRGHLGRASVEPGEAADLPEGGICEPLLEIADVDDDQAVR